MLRFCWHTVGSMKQITNLAHIFSRCVAMALDHREEQREASGRKKRAKLCLQSIVFIFYGENSRREKEMRINGTYFIESSLEWPCKKLYVCVLSRKMFFWGCFKLDCSLCCLYGRRPANSNWKWDGEVKCVVEDEARKWCEPSSYTHLMLNSMQLILRPTPPGAKVFRPQINVSCRYSKPLNINWVRAENERERENVVISR